MVGRQSLAGTFACDHRRMRFGIVRALLASLIVLATPALRAADAQPPGVAGALDRSKLPREALVAMVQEVGPNAAGPRLSWRSDQPVNPASLMKLLTSYAALETLGPAWSWSTPVWLQGTLRDGVLEGNLVIKACARSAATSCSIEAPSSCLNRTRRNSMAKGCDPTTSVPTRCC
jgi:D-alanyl-D-alanine carboxypeptidase